MTLAEDDLAMAIAEAQRRTFAAFRVLYDAVNVEAELTVKRREQVRLAALETPRRVITLPVAVIEPHDLYELFRSIFGRHPHGITSSGVRLRGVARDEYRFEAVE